MSESRWLATGLEFLTEILSQFGQRYAGRTDLKVVFHIGVGGPGAAAVGPGEAVTTLGLPTGTFLVGHMDSHQPDLVAVEHLQKVQQPVTRPDQIIGDDVDPLVQG